jgi:hypothetical protein
MSHGIEGLDSLLDLLREVAAKSDAADEDLYTDGCGAALLLEAERRRLNRQLTAAVADGLGDSARVDRARELGRSLEEVSSLLEALRRLLSDVSPTSQRGSGRFRSRDPGDAPAAALPEQK